MERHEAERHARMVAESPSEPLPVVPGIDGFLPLRDAAAAMEMTEDEDTQPREARDPRVEIHWAPAGRGSGPQCSEKSGADGDAGSPDAGLTALLYPAFVLIRVDVGRARYRRARLTARREELLT
jgi:hypothetical protein